MNKNQSNHLYMFKAVDLVLNKYNAQVNGLPSLMEASTTYRNNLKRIEDTLLIQEGQTTGIAQQKQKEEDAMIVTVLRVAAAMYVYAQDNNNLELSAKVHLSKNIKGLSDARLLNIGKTVLNLARDLADNALANYGVTAADINQLEEKIVNFEKLTIQPRSAVITRSQATTLLGRLFKETTALLKDKMDKLILILATDHPLFYNEYRAARTIVDLHGAKSTEEDEDDDEADNTKVA